MLNETVRGQGSLLDLARWCGVDGRCIRVALVSLLVSGKGVLVVLQRLGVCLVLGVQRGLQLYVISFCALASLCAARKLTSWGGALPVTRGLSSLIVLSPES